MKKLNNEFFQLKQHYTSNRKDLIKRIKGRLGSIPDAEDVVQEAYARALKFWEHYNHTRPLDGWVLGILFNALSDFKREERQHGMPVLEEPVFDVEEYHAARDLVRQVVSKSYGREKDILTLSFEKGYSDKDIGDILGLKYDAVKYILRSFRKKLKNNLH